MNGWLDAVALRIADFQLLAALLLIVVMIAQAALGQPVRRLAVAKSALIALVLLAALCALPRWSLVHLAAGQPSAPAPTEAFEESIASAVDAPLQPPLPAESMRPAHSITNTTAANASIELPHATWQSIVISAFAFGTAAVAAWLVLGAAAGRRLLREAAPAPVELRRVLAELAFGDRAVPALLVSDRVETAVALGVRGPTIVLPSQWTKSQSVAELRTVLAHELAHIRNGDLRWLALSRLLLLLLWPQPLFWLLRRRMGLDQEALADASAADATSRQQYAEQLVAWARSIPHRPRIALPAAVGLWEGPSQLRRRIALLLDERLTILRRCPRAWAAGVALLAIALSTVLSLATLQPADQALADVTKTVMGTETHHSTVMGSTQFTATVVGNPPHPWAYKPNVLRVEVQDEAGKPLAGVDAAVYRASHLSGTRALAGQGTTDETGTAEFAGLVVPEAAARYAEMAAKSQMPQRLGEMFYVVLRRPGLGTVILPAWDFEVAAHGIQRKVRMRPAAELSGRVTNSAGEPVAGATVAAGGLAGRFALEGANAVKSDADGRYRFTGLVTFDRQAANKKESETANTWMAFDRNDSNRYPPVYDPTDATSISDLVISHSDYAVTTVRGGDVPGTTDVVMAPAAAIEGRVVDFATGKHVAGVLVRAAGAPRTPEVSDEQVKARGVTLTIATLHTASTQTDADGRYRLANLPAGKYDVWPEPEIEANHLQVGRGITGAQAKAGDEPTVVDDIVIGPGGIIRGQLIDANTDKPLIVEDGASLRATYFLVDGPSQQSSQSQSVPVTADGSFELQAIPGRLRIFLLVHLPGDNSHPHGDYRSGDESLQTGPVFDLAHGESTEADFPVWSRAEQDVLRAQWMRGYELMNQEKYDEAVAQFSQLLASKPNDTTALLGRARSYELANREAEAAADYETLLKVNPDDVGAKERLGRLLATSPDASVRNGRRAVELLTDVVAATRRNPPNEFALSIELSQLAAAYAEAGDFEAAVATQREAIETN